MRKFILSFLFMIIGAGLGFAGVHFHPTKWQVSAQFEAPKMRELGNYFSLFSTYKSLSISKIILSYFFNITLPLP